MRILLALVTAVTLVATTGRAADGTNDYRSLLSQAVLLEDGPAQIELIKQLVGASDELVARGLAAWRMNELYVHTAADGAKIPFLLDAQQDSEGKGRGVRLTDSQFIKDDHGEPVIFLASSLTPADTNSKLRKAIKTTLDLFAIGNPMPNMRRDAVIKLGQEQNPEYLPYFQSRLKIESDAQVIAALTEAVALTQIVDPDDKIRNAAINSLARMQSINALDFLKQLEKKVTIAPAKYSPQTARALRDAIVRIETHISWVHLFGTAFHGLSLASVLLIAALGLAITFGLMGVINMAHGEIMAVGAYTTYLVQGVFGSGLLFSLFGHPVSIKGFGLSGGRLDCYFLVALAASFFFSGSGRPGPGTWGYPVSL